MRSLTPDIGFDVPIDLPIKIAHIIRDFEAVLQFVEFIERVGAGAGELET